MTDVMTVGMDAGMDTGLEPACASSTTPGAPTVSVIIPSFNHERDLQECVDSVLSQHPAPLQVIVADDGSSDGSLALLRGYGSRITLLQQARGRQARARNAGLAVAQGELVAFLDSDDRYRPGRLAAALAAFQAEPQATLVWSDHRSIGASGQLLGSHRWKASGPDFRHTLIAGNPICNATVTVRRAALQAIDGFNESVPRACDGAAWYQLAALGHRFVHLSQELVDYRLHGSNDSQAFVAMARDRDAALQAAAQAYIKHGVLTTRAELTWLRQALLRQFAFGAAAQVQRQLGAGTWSRARAAALQALGSGASLCIFAGLKAAKDLLVGRP